MKICHDSHNLYFRDPFGAVTVNTDVNIRLDIHDPAGTVKVFLLTEFNERLSEIPMAAGCSESGLLSFHETWSPGGETGLMFYCFRVESGDQVFFYGNNYDRLGGVGQIWENDPIPFQITVYRQDHIPEWFRKGIAYQIFPDRFARSEGYLELQEKAARAYLEGLDVPEDVPLRSIQSNWDDIPCYPRDGENGVKEWIFAGGSLDGISSRLDYLSDLGVTILYINPIFRASSNHKYDTFDYLRIDDAFGDENAFISLCSKAKDRGIRIILDGVFNHTGADSRYFNLFGRKGYLGAAQGPVSPYYDWYSFTESGYESWWGVRDLPNVREMTPSYIDFIYNRDDGVVRHWLRLGASGWRLDVADELPDEFIAGIRRAMLEEAPESILLGEVWEDASNKTSYGVLRKYFMGDELQSTMNYPFRTAALSFMKGDISAGMFAGILMSLKENYPRENFYACLNLIGSHDRARVLNELSDTRAILENRISDAGIELNDEELNYIRKGVSRADSIKAVFRIPKDKLALAKDRLKVLSLLQFVMPGVPCIYYGDEAGMQGFEDPYNRGSFPWGNEDPELEKHYHMLCRLRKDHPVLTEGDFLASGCTEHVVCFERFTNESHFALYVNRGIFEWETVTSLLSGETFTLPPLGWKIICK